ncbi:MAG: nicotinate (nicotinamide) nucleotide adenylyltransferase [Alistipes sp.]|nr:nicotinate (nicotinamide) nucleotide adenylyltransferase [Alistipes sp.]
MKNVLLYFGSFNPVHRGHIALAQYAIERKIADEVILIVSPQNPHKQSDDLAPEFSRYEMCSLACQASCYPDSIKVSAVEFTLPRPSYTIDTLRFLSDNFGNSMSFSILMGADNIERFDSWKEYEQILENYPIYVYPRRGYNALKLADKVTYLADAPLFDFSATDVRNAVACRQPISDMVCVEVEKYIRSNNLWSAALYIAALSAKLTEQPDDISALLERGTWYFRDRQYTQARADFMRVLSIDSRNREANSILNLIDELINE